MGEHRHQMRCGGPGAARPPQRLAVQSDRQQPVRAGLLRGSQGGEVGTQAPVQIGGIEPREHETSSRWGAGTGYLVVCLQNNRWLPR